MRANRGNALAKIILALVLAGGGVLVAFLGFRAPAVVAEVQRGNAVDAVPGSVVVYADKDLQELTIEGAGRVVECARLDEGNLFTKGEILLKLDMSEIDRNLAEAKRKYENDRELAELRRKGNSDVSVAQQALDNARALLELGGASARNVEEARRALDAASTEQAVAEFTAKRAKEDYEQFVEASEILKRKMIVVAPGDGMVEGANVYVGKLVGAGATVATFYANERVVVARISEEDIDRVKLGDPARVQLLTFPGRDFDAKVTKILPFADAETRRYSVHLEVKAALAELRPNSTGEVTITVGTHPNVPLVPRRAIFNGNFVFVVSDGRIERRRIEIGYRDLTTAEVSRGLAPGEKVVVENLDAHRDGQRVRVEAIP